MYSFFGKSFQKAKYAESTNVLCNPDRGLFQMFTVLLGEEPDFQRFESCLIPTERLVFLLVDIAAYKETELPSDALEKMSDVIEFFSEREKDIILRVVYDHQGQALDYEPATFSLVKKHLEQIATFVSTCHHQVFVYQGILVGNWGEMHTSKFLGKVKMREMVEILDQHLAGKVYLAVRRPCFYRQIRDELPARQADDKCRMGLYNDAIFGSISDMGTYGEALRSVWEGAWHREAELDFQNELCMHAPCGGESVWGDVFIHSLSGEDIIDTLKRMHLTYLNRLYDQKMLEYFKKIRLNSEGVWKGHTLYEYIEAHLGYRFLVRDVSMRMDKELLVRHQIKLEITVENTGFSNIYRDGTISLYIRDISDGREQKIQVGNLSKITCGHKYVYEVFLPVVNEKKNKTEIYLCANRMFDQSEIFFGNESVKGGRVYLGCLNGFRINEVC